MCKKKSFKNYFMKQNNYKQIIKKIYFYELKLNFSNKNLYKDLFTILKALNT